MFSYVGGISLSGFPKCKLLDQMGKLVGDQAIFRQDRERMHGENVVYPSFPLQYVKERQAFFESLPSDFEYDWKIDFPRAGQIGDTKRSLLAFCTRTYQAMEQARAYLKKCDVPEARRVLARAKVFDEELRASLETLKGVIGSRYFAIDTQTRVMVPLDRMPSHGREHREDQASYGWEFEQHMKQARYKVGDRAVSIAKRGVREFRRRIIDFVDDELKYREGSFRKEFEDFAAPVRLYGWYQEYLRHALDRVHFGVRDEVAGKRRFPKLGDHYDVRGLYPPTLLGWERYAVPIGFRSKKNERKFLMAGLHSGSKSFHLKNLALLSILAQTPLPIFAEQAVVPRFRRIFYYENQFNSDGEGKAITELKDLRKIVEQCGEQDVIFIDELAKSMPEDVASYIVPEALARAEKVGTTILMVSHRLTDYRRLRKQGWTIMTPDFEIRKGKVEPTKTLRRGIPDSAINRRFVRERFLDE